jgi:hypothetical protein
LLKSELKTRLGVVRKAFDKQIKDKEAAANKEVGLSKCLFVLNLTLRHCGGIFRR